MSVAAYPSRPGAVVVRARLEHPLSRWLWLVKWVLLIPHYVVLAFLGLAFAVVTVVAFVAILVTGRYPRSLFAFNLGVLRWSWRVAYYGYSALGTDRYPPFSLGAEPDYPATLDIAYPERLSRGLVLVKWWLLAIPHYLVLGVVLGGAAWTTTTVSTASGVTRTTATGTSLLTLLVCFAAVAMLFTGRYPRGLYDFATGIDRWVLRVVAYVTLMTDEYPPFRLDQGGDEAGDPRGPEPVAPGGSAAVPVAGGPVTAGPVAGPVAASQPGPGPGSRAGAVVALVAGIVAVLVGLGLTTAGGLGLWVDGRRDAAGFVSTDARLLSTPTAAVTAENVDLRIGSAADAWVTSDRFGTVRVRAASADGTPVFIGVAPQAAVDGWLAGVAHDQVRNIGSAVTYLRSAGRVVAAPSPTAQTFWTASVSGSGTQELRWRVTSGRWALVLARSDGAPGVAARTDVGANVPDLRALSGWVLAIGIVLLGAGVVLIVVGAAGLGRRGAAAPPPPGGPWAPAVPPQAGPPAPRAEPAAGRPEEPAVPPVTPV
jgi:hypothetical protein